MAQFCENCGAPLTSDVRFCEKCGHPVGLQSGEIVSTAPVAEAAAPHEAQQSAAELVLTVPAAPMIVSTPQPVTPIVLVEGPTEVLVPAVEEAPAAPLNQSTPSVVNPSRKNQSLRPVLVGVGVGVLILALVGGGVYLMKQRQAPVPPPVVEVTKSPAQLEGEINHALRDAGLNEVFSAVDDRFGVLLKGTVPTEALKVKAIETARSFPTVTGVKDMIFVVEP